MVTVTVKSAGDLLNQFRTLARVADPEAARQVLDGLDALENGGALNWLNRAKPVLAMADLIAQAPGGPPSMPVVTVLLPITGRDEFLDGLKAVGFDVDDKPGVEGFSHKFVPPGGAGQPVYLLSDPPAGYAVVTTVPAGAARLRAIKAADLKPARRERCLSASALTRSPSHSRRRPSPT